MQVTIGGRVFPSVEVSNKKEGRAEAAAMALKILMGEGSFQIQQDNAVKKLHVCPFCFSLCLSPFVSLFLSLQI